MVKQSKRIPGVSKAVAAQRLKALGARLRQRRLELGLVQARVARECGWEPTRLWKYEDGRALPSYSALECLAGILRLDLQELLRLSGLSGKGRS